MKERILTAVVLLPVLVVVLILHNTIVLNIACAVICVSAVYEVLHNTGYVPHRELVIPALLVAAYFPFSQMELFTPYFHIVLLVYLVVLFAMLFLHHDRIQFQEVATTFFVSLVVSFALSSIVFVSNLEPELALYLIVLIFSCAWISDAGAYFVGRKFGKHPLAPTISPKKTVEGLIGGILSSLLVNYLFTYVYTSIAAANGLVTEIFPLRFFIMISIATLLGVVGDLNASIIKRQCGIKDFGRILPGHGGIMDRFDSILFIAPFVYVTYASCPFVMVLN